LRAEYGALWSDRIEVTDLVYRLGVCLHERGFDEMRQLLVEDASVRTLTRR